MSTCTHNGNLTEGYYGHNCADCGELLYPFGCEPWNYLTDEEQAQIDREEYRATHWTCTTCGGEFWDGGTSCTCLDDLDVSTMAPENEGGPYCTHCGQELEYIECDQCEDGYSYHDCGEDCCCCLDPEPNVRCEQCGGAGGWHWCSNRECPGKVDKL